MLKAMVIRNLKLFSRQSSCFPSFGVLIIILYILFLNIGYGNVIDFQT